MRCLLLALVLTACTPTYGEPPAVKQGCSTQAECNTDAWRCKKFGECHCAMKPDGIALCAAVSASDCALSDQCHAPNGWCGEPWNGWCGQALDAK
jgi:hypothetical protein